MQLYVSVTRGNAPSAVVVVYTVSVIHVWPFPRTCFNINVSTCPSLKKHSFLFVAPRNCQARSCTSDDDIHAATMSLFRGTDGTGKWVWILSQILSLVLAGDSFVGEDRRTRLMYIFDPPPFQPTLLAVRLKKCLRKKCWAFIIASAAAETGGRKSQPALQSHCQQEDNFICALNRL